MTTDDVTPGRATPPLAAQHLDLAYEEREVITDLSVSVKPRLITSIVGANACGKSTLLRGLSRLLAPRRGAVHLNGRDIHKLPTRDVALQLGILPQSPTAPEGITVADLVARGRYPHQSWFGRLSPHDEQVIASAMEITKTLELAERPVDELSGGQRQRVWIAVALAQDTDLMLLDEPTTYLDLAHQIDVLDVLTDLNQQRARTILMVLHDLNLACRYSHHLIAMKDGRVVAQGEPARVMDPDLVHEVFGLQCQVVPDPVSRTPLVIPIGRHRAGSVPDGRPGMSPDRPLTGTSTPPIGIGPEIGESR